mmetsp:Transcript_21662/g.34856  ORF Transcript_21662/g.34856 Transcript_21662/m.34856 type:complete len:86 (-) Transcript_21662:1448-1705(-)
MGAPGPTPPLEISTIQQHVVVMIAKRFASVTTTKIVPIATSREKHNRQQKSSNNLYITRHAIRIFSGMIAFDHIILLSRRYHLFR